MKIIDVRATTVTVPLEAPLRHANGATGDASSDDLETKATPGSSASAKWAAGASRPSPACSR